MNDTIGTISPIWDSFPSGFDKQLPQESGGANVFADIFQYAIGNVVEAEEAKNHAEYLLATGQLDNPAEATIAAAKMELSVDLLVQLRNKALDAYNELMRIGL